jgi:hypothetical protein
MRSIRCYLLLLVTYFINSKEHQLCVKIASFEVQRYSDKLAVRVVQFTGLAISQEIIVRCSYQR